LERKQYLAPVGNHRTAIPRLYRPQPTFVIIFYKMLHFFVTSGEPKVKILEAEAATVVVVMVVVVIVIVVVVVVAVVE
jgi:hypothetical protein